VASKLAKHKNLLFSQVCFRTKVDDTDRRLPDSFVGGGEY